MTGPDGAPPIRAGIGVATGDLRAVVVTGSRAAPSLPVKRALDAWLGRLPSGAVGMLVIHGACPTGADAAANQWAIFERGIGVVPMPAQWEVHGRSAGPIRNGRMLRLAESLRECGWTVDVLAFPMGESRGTRGCMDAFESLGFNVLVHELPAPGGRP